MKKILILFIFIVSSANTFAIGRLYIVKPHDTLWAISKRFYKDPFLWGKIWKNNTYINDPNLIFPGEILRVGKYGLELYTKKVKIKHVKKIRYKKYLSAVWYDGKKFYTPCGIDYCVWKRSQFEVAKISFDTYNHVDVTIGNIVYLHTNRSSLPEKLYIYRKFKNILPTSILSPEEKIFIPIGEIKVLGKICNGVFRAKVVRANGEIQKSDIVSGAYPFEFVKKLNLVRLGNIKVEQMIMTQNELQEGLGFLMFFKAQRRLPILVGKEVELARLNRGSPLPVVIGRGVIISQYENYVGIYFPSIDGLKEIPDRTQQYVLR